MNWIERKKEGMLHSNICDLNKAALLPAVLVEHDCTESIFPLRFVGPLFAISLCVSHCTVAHYHFSSTQKTLGCN
jgi:hypothetical protein